MQTDIRCLLQSNGIKLGPAQRRRLEWLAERYGAPFMQRGAETSVAEAGVIIVAEPPSGARAERFCRTLQAGCVVAIPFGENPAFDFLKSKLVAFGTVGPCGADGPHELWWGGVEWPTGGLNGMSSPAPPRIISCYRRGIDEGPALRLRRTLASLQLAFDIQPITTEVGDQIGCAQKTDFMLRMWRQYRQPLLFVEIDAVLRHSPLLPTTLECEFAVHKWNHWEMSARTLYLGTSDATETLLQTWHQLANLYPAIWEGYLLDQAWSLTSSQMPLDTVWLPRSYHALTGEFAARHAAIVHNLPTTTADLGPDPDFAADLRVARRAGRTGARDSFMVLRSPSISNKSVAVILRDVESRDARAVAASIEALTSAFARDCGGYGQFELSLCAWQDDVRIAREAAISAQCRVLEIAVGQTVNPDMFCSLAQREAAYLSSPTTAADTFSNQEPVIR
jgi:hypothetical protein